MFQWSKPPTSIQTSTCSDKSTTNARCQDTWILPVAYGFPFHGWWSSQTYQCCIINGNCRTLKSRYLSHIKPYKAIELASIHGLRTSIYGSWNVGYHLCHIYIHIHIYIIYSHTYPFTHNPKEQALYMVGTSRNRFLTPIYPPIDLFQGQPQREQHIPGKGGSDAWVCRKNGGCYPLVN